MSAAMNGAMACAASAVMRRIAMVDSSSRLAREPNSSRNASWSSATQRKYALKPSSVCCLPEVASATALRDGVAQPGAGLVEQRQVEVLLAVEVLVEHRLGDAGGIGDVVHRRGVEAPMGEHLHRHVEDLLTAGRGGKAHAHKGYQRVTRPEAGAKPGRGPSHSPRSRSSRSAAFTA